MSSWKLSSLGGFPLGKYFAESINFSQGAIEDTRDWNVKTAHYVITFETIGSRLQLDTPFIFLLPTQVLKPSIFFSGRLNLGSEAGALSGLTVPIPFPFRSSQALYAR
jgi:hypothetical protein